jgi:hypothetical protein
MENDMKSNEINRVTDVTDQFDINVTRAHARTREDIPKGPDTSVTQRAKQASLPARRMIGRSPEPSETEAIKRYGWRDQGVLVVSADDRRLTWPERELVRQIGSRLYGRTPRGDRR